MDIEKTPQRKRSMSQGWQCPACRTKFSVPNRTQNTLTRRCKCGKVYVFGPASGDGKYKATTNYVSWDWM